MSIALETSIFAEAKRQADELCAEIDKEVMALDSRKEALLQKKATIINNVDMFISSFSALYDLGALKSFQLFSTQAFSGKSAEQLKPLVAAQTGTLAKLPLLANPTGHKSSFSRHGRSKTIVVGPRATTTDAHGNKVSYTSEIMRVVQKHHGIATIPDIRDEVAKGPMGAKMAVTDKGFYSGLEKLKQKHLLIKHRGYIFTKTAKAKHDKDVASGLKKELPELTGRKAPLADTILALISETPGINSKAIVTKLIENPETTDSISKNHTGAYNVLSRLTARGVIEKRDDGGYALVSNENDRPSQAGQTTEVGSLS